MTEFRSNSDADTRVAVRANLRAFMYLTPIERSCVVLMDVLDYSVADIVSITGASVLSVKGALHRGRRRLRAVADLPFDAKPPRLEPEVHALLDRYAALFNEHDFVAVANLLAEEVEFQVVARAKLRGRAEVRRVYFGNYAGTDGDWRLEPGVVERRPALLVFDRESGAEPAYFILVEIDGRGVSRARDFRHARYVIESAEYRRLTRP